MEKRIKRDDQREKQGKLEKETKLNSNNIPNNKYAPAVGILLSQRQLNSVNEYEQNGKLNLHNQTDILKVATQFCLDI